MTLIHERDSHGEDTYRLGGGTTTPANEKKADKKSQAKDSKTKDVAEDAKSGDNGPEHDGQQNTAQEEKNAASAGNIKEQAKAEEGGADADKAP